MTDFDARRTMMVDTQVRPSDVTKYPIIDAMLTVPREKFVPASMKETAYAGENLVLEENRVVLEPRTFAKMLEALDVTPNELVLDVGPSYGYSSAVIARLAQMVVAVEEEKSMAREAEEALVDAGADNVAVQLGPLVEGASEHGPYDVIVLQGGIAALPVSLEQQLKDGGRIAAVFMDNALGEVRIGHKQNGKITWRMVFNAAAPVLPGFEKEEEFKL